MNRYYQIKVNSLANQDHDDINYITKLAERNIRCIKCGTNKSLKLKSRKKKNNSSERKYCRYLRSLCYEYCDKCSERKAHKLFGRQSILNKLDAKSNDNKVKHSKEDPKKKSSDKQELKSIIPTPSQSNSAKRGSKKKLALPVIKLPPKQQPSDSGLRAFSCLLK